MSDARDALDIATRQQLTPPEHEERARAKEAVDIWKVFIVLMQTQIKNDAIRRRDQKRFNVVYDGGAAAGAGAGEAKGTKSM